MKGKHISKKVSRKLSEKANPIHKLTLNQLLKLMKTLDVRSHRYKSIQLYLNSIIY